MELQLNSIDQISPEFLKAYREEKKLFLKDFWGAIGCTTSRGHSYEIGKIETPEVVKRLLMLHYGLGIPTDCQSEEYENFAEALRNGNLTNVGMAAKLLEKAHALLIDQTEPEAQP